MAAGQVIAPSIIPLRAPIPGKSKTEIDTNTLIELKTGNERNSIAYSKLEVPVGQSSEILDPKRTHVSYCKRLQILERNLNN